MPFDSGTVQTDGAIVGSFSDYDSLVEALRERISAVGLSHRILEEISGMSEGALAKYLADLRCKHLSISSLLQIAEAVGVRGILVTDDAMLRRVRPMWEMRQAKKAHSGGLSAKRLGPVTIARVLPDIAREMGRRGGLRRRELPAETRRALAQAAARARWRSRRPCSS
jgi:hypothetical protein